MRARPRNLPSNLTFPLGFRQSQSLRKVKVIGEEQLHKISACCNVGLFRILNFMGAIVAQKADLVKQANQLSRHGVREFLDPLIKSPFLHRTDDLQGSFHTTAVCHRGGSQPVIVVVPLRFFIQGSHVRRQVVYGLNLWRLWSLPHDLEPFSKLDLIKVIGRVVGRGIVDCVKDYTLSTLCAQAKERPETLVSWHGIQCCERSAFGPAIPMRAVVTKFAHLARHLSYCRVSLSRKSSFSYNGSQP